MNRSEYLSFWLMPTASDRAWLQPIIDHLARTYGSTTFEPHVTVFSCPALQVEQTFLQCSDKGVDSMTWDQLQAVLNSRLTTIADTTVSFDVDIKEIDVDEPFSKTIFLRLQNSIRLKELIQQISQALLYPSEMLVSSSKSTPEAFDPHISLLYQRLDRKTKNAIAQSLQLPSRRIRFDEIRVVRAPGQFVTQGDVQALHSMWAQKLCKRII